MHLRPTVVLLLLAACMCTARAGSVYKCTNPQGAITFQDQPCRAGDTETTIHLATPPPAPAPPSASGEEATTTESPPPPTAPAAATQVQRALPPLWLCTRPEDGSHFVSHDGATPPRMVPAGVLGMPNKPLAQAYGPGGISVSAPGVRRIPVDTSPQAAVAGAYVAIQDHCERATPEQTCDYLREQHDQVQAKLRRAFKDEQAELQPQADELDKQMRGC